MDQAGRTGLVPIITVGSVQDVLADVRYWRIETVVLADGVHGAKWTVDEEAIRRTAIVLLGGPTSAWTTCCGVEVPPPNPASSSAHGATGRYGTGWQT